MTKDEKVRFLIVLIGILCFFLFAPYTFFKLTQKKLCEGWATAGANTSLAKNFVIQDGILSERERKICKIKGLIEFLK